MDMNIASVDGTESRPQGGVVVAILAESLRQSEVQAETLMNLIASVPEMPEGVGKNFNSLA